MAHSKFKARRKLSGGLYRGFRKKRLSDLAGDASLTKLAKKRLQILRVKGNNLKQRLLSTDTVNLYDPKTKKYEQVKVKTTKENPANRHFIRRNIMTKGAIIETEKGNAKITSRPGQDGVINAVLIS